MAINVPFRRDSAERATGGECSTPPLSSSPCTAADTNSRRPSRRPSPYAHPQRQRRGVYSCGTGRSIVVRVPGSIDLPQINRSALNPSRVFVLPCLVRSMNLMICPATSCPVAASMPSRPGEEVDLEHDRAVVLSARCRPRTRSIAIRCAAYRGRAFLGRKPDETMQRRHNAGWSEIRRHWPGASSPPPPCCRSRGSGCLRRPPP